MVSFGEVFGRFGQQRTQIQQTRTQIIESKAAIAQRRQEIATARAEGTQTIKELRKPEPKIRTRQFAEMDPTLFIEERQLKKQRKQRIEAKQRAVRSVETQLQDIEKAEKELTIAEKEILTTETLLKQQEQQLTKQETQIKQLEKEPGIQIRETNGELEFFKLIPKEPEPARPRLSGQTITSSFGEQVPVELAQAQIFFISKSGIPNSTIVPWNQRASMERQLQGQGATVQNVLLISKEQVPQARTQEFVQSVFLRTLPPEVLAQTPGFEKFVKVEKVREVKVPQILQEALIEQQKKGIVKIDPITKQPIFFPIKEPKQPTGLEVTEELLTETIRLPVLPGTISQIGLGLVSTVFAVPGAIAGLIGRRKEFEQLAIVAQAVGIRPFEREKQIKIIAKTLGIRERVGGARFPTLLDIPLEQVGLAPPGTTELFAKYPAFAIGGIGGEIAFFIGAGAAIKATTKAITTVGKIGVRRLPTVTRTFQEFIESSSRPISVPLGKQFGLLTERIKGGVSIPLATKKILGVTIKARIPFDVRRVFDVAAGTKVPVKVLTIVERKGARIGITEAIPGTIEGAPITTRVTGTLRFFRQRLTDIGRREFVSPKIAARARPGEVIEVAGLFRPGERIQISTARIVGRTIRPARRLFRPTIRPGRPGGLLRAQITIQEVGLREVEPLFRRSFLVTTEPAKLAGFIRAPGEIQLQRIIARGIKLPPTIRTLPPVIKPGFLAFQPKPTGLFTFRFARRSFKSFSEFLGSREASQGLILQPRAIPTVTRIGARTFISEITAGRAIALPIKGLGVITTTAVTTIPRTLISIQPQELEQPVAFRQAEKQIRIQRTDQEKIFRQLQEQTRLQIREEEILPVSITGEKEILAQISGEETIQLQLQGQKQLQLQQQEQRQLFQRITDIRILRVPIPTGIRGRPAPPPPIPFRLEAPITMEVPKEELLQGYNVLVKERFIVKGKKVRPERFIKMNPRPLSRQDALAFGGHLVDESAARSFKIIKTDRPAQVLRLNIPSFASFKFRMKEDVFIELTDYAIDTQGEVDEIPARAVLSRLQREQRIRQPRRRRERETAVMELPVMDLFADLDKQFRRLSFGF